MKITKVSVRVIPNRPRLKGTASVVFDDCFKVRDILILPRNAEELYASMPYKRVKDGTFIQNQPQNAYCSQQVIRQMR